MNSPEAQTAPSLASVRRVVIKVGSALLVSPDSGRLREAWLGALAADIAMLRARGIEALIVSSGAIALGRALLSLPGDKGSPAFSLSEAQAAAAAGQIRLAHAWSEALAPHGLVAAQILLTLEDTADRRRYLNGRETLNRLLALGAVAIANENDTTATDEIRYGDNDRLAARVAMMAGADTLILLSDVDGLYSADPRKEPQARHIPFIHEIDAVIESMAGACGSRDSRGGMRTKLEAARIAMHAGCKTAIARGLGLAPVSTLFGGGRASWFLTGQSPDAARKQWISGMKPRGALIVDEGAASALQEGRSLLPAGVRRVQGTFKRGDPVSIETERGGRVAIALAGFGSDEAKQVAGLRTGEIARILGPAHRSVIAHRDNMVVWR